MAAPLTVNGLDEIKGLVGREVGPTGWRTVRQEDIDAFAELSGDRQWIHVDVERAQRETPFGGTIAHGNLTLSMIDGFRTQLVAFEGVAFGVNRGWNRVRFLSPVRSGASIRARAVVDSVDEVAPGQWDVVQRFTIDIDGVDKPACVAESVVRVYAG